MTITIKDGVGGEDGTWRSKMQLGEFTKHSRIATAKLRRHYERLEFRALKGTPFMFRLADILLPTPADLARFGTEQESLLPLVSESE